MRTRLGRREKPSPLGGLMAELMTQDPKRPGRVAEAPGHLVGRPLLHEETAQGFVLALEGQVGRQEELRGTGKR
ncbi:MAG TPA: hypothetical protein ENH11_07320 [Candidatus Acetothermia bacterium]|nr:hypothetical protein [Candidatus Acetothermia bacterium]